MGADGGDGVAEGGEPCGEVVAVEDELGCGANGAGAGEVMRGKGGDAEAGERGSQAAEPEGDRTAGAVEDEECGMAAGRGRDGDVQGG